MTALAPLHALAQAQTQLAELGPKPFPLPLGPLAPVVAGAVPAMAKSDWLVTGPAERLGAVLRGCPVKRLIDPALGARPYKLAPVSGTPGARALHAVGLAIGSGEPVLCFIGMASAASGSVHEALNTAALSSAPVIFLHVSRPLTPQAPVATQLAGDLGEIARAHGLQVEALDLAAASDDDARVASTYAAVKNARQRLAANGPQVLIVDLA
ncbi:MAG: hypothetical protein GXP62_05305 [Oligoflexia bacterium]|nr:hypothetical protein [Oligoflexia bacterium]